MLNKTSQTQKMYIVLFFVYKVAIIVQSIEKESRLVMLRAGKYSMVSWLVKISFPLYLFRVSEIFSHY